MSSLDIILPRFCFYFASESDNYNYTKKFSNVNVFVEKTIIRGMETQR